MGAEPLNPLCPPQLHQPQQPYSQQFLLGVGCPGCGSGHGNKVCANGFCRKCCHKAAAANPGHPLCHERKHALSINALQIQPNSNANISIAPPLLALPQSSHSFIPTPVPLSHIPTHVPPTLSVQRPCEDISRALPPGWANNRDISLQLQAN